MDEVLFSEMSFHGRCWNAILQIASCFFCHIVISLCAFILVFILLLIQESTHMHEVEEKESLTAGDHPPLRHLWNIWRV